MKIKFTDIDWDKGGEEVELPEEATIEVEDEEDIEERLADILSDEYGWCVNSFNYKIL